MKTLDEVIKALEYCKEDLDNCPEDCPFASSCSPWAYAMKVDALHYLKEYRRVRSQPDNCCIDDYDKPMWNPKDHWG